jgi:hypothetical protein
MTTTILAGLGLVVVVVLLWYGFRAVLGPKRQGPVAPGSRPGPTQAVSPPAPPATPSPTTGPIDFTEVSGLTKAQAEELLDWLESNGCQEFGVSEFSARGYTVRYRQPAAKAKNKNGLRRPGTAEVDHGGPNRPR